MVNSDRKIYFYLDPPIHLSKQLDEKSFCDGFSFIWGQWTDTSEIGVTSVGRCLFKLSLWCLRYCYESQSC